MPRQSPEQPEPMTAIRMGASWPSRPPRGRAFTAWSRSSETSTAITRVDGASALRICKAMCPRPPMPSTATAPHRPLPEPHIRGVPTTHRDRTPARALLLATAVEWGLAARAARRDLSDEKMTIAAATTPPVRTQRGTPADDRNLDHLHARGRARLWAFFVAVAGLT